MLKNRLSKLFIILATTIISAGIQNVQAITIDEFDGSQIVFDPPFGALSNASVVSSEGSLGGTRSVRSIRAAGTENVQLSVSSGTIKHSQGSGTTGASVITWDGNSGQDYADGNLNGRPSDPTGLGGVDLAEDGADSFQIKVRSFDRPFGTGTVSLQLVIYDASDVTGNTYKTCTKYKYQTDPANNPGQYSALTNNPLDVVVSEETIFLFPFSDCEIGQLLYPMANFENVGAIVFKINNGSSDVDLTVSQFSTNGECPTFPQNGTVYSICNKCINLPNPNSCVDCAGTPFGTATPGTTCDTGEVGVCEDGIYQGQVTYIVNQQNCSCKRIVEPGTESCDTKDNDCDGQVDENLFDVCGICGGNGTTCLDCAGTPFGTKVLDQCNVCGGNGTTCLDCAGTPNGNKVVDQCGVCGGNNTTCLDCAGTPNGTKKVDQCGICGGDGKSCIDCKGTLNGTVKVDKCGVCGGDNTSCLECIEKDISEIQFELDHGAKQHEKIINKMLRALGSKDKSKATASYIRKAASKAHTLQLRNWTLSWTLTSKIQICGNTALCTQASNDGVLNEYRSHSKELLDIGNEVIAKLKKLKVNVNKFNKDNINRHNTNLGLAATVPSQFSTGCNLN